MFANPLNFRRIRLYIIENQVSRGTTGCSGSASRGPHSQNSCVCKGEPILQATVCLCRTPNWLKKTGPLGEAK